MCTRGLQPLNFQGLKAPLGRFFSSDLKVGPPELEVEARLETKQC